MRKAEATVTNRKATANASLAISSGSTDSVTRFEQLNTPSSQKGTK